MQTIATHLSLIPPNPFPSTPRISRHFGSIGQVFICLYRSMALKPVIQPPLTLFSELLLLCGVEEEVQTMQDLFFFLLLMTVVRRGGDAAAVEFNSKCNTKRNAFWLEATGAAEILMHIFFH